jgi:predicted HAD superfamily Cof-like phosphohydrolase
MINKMILDVEAFHKATDTPIQDTPCIPSDERMMVRETLIMEEFEELMRGMAHYDLTNIAQELVDLIYVAIGTALELGIPLQKVWDEVQRANMNKVDPVTGKVRKREDGKVLKPEGWQKPDVHAALWDGGTML